MLANPRRQCLNMQISRLTMRETVLYKQKRSLFDKVISVEIFKKTQNRYRSNARQVAALTAQQKCIFLVDRIHYIFQPKHHAHNDFKRIFSKNECLLERLDATVQNDHSISKCTFGDHLQRRDRIIDRKYVMCLVIVWYSSGQRFFRVPMVCRGTRNPTARVRSSRVRLFIFLLAYPFNKNRKKFLILLAPLYIILILQLGLCLG